MVKAPLTRRRQTRRMINANRYLKRRVGQGRSGERWYLQVPVPKNPRSRLGCALIERALNTSDPRVARIRRDELLGEIRAMFTAARAEPALDDVLCATRREEMARAHATWSELVADRGVAAARQAFAMLLDDEYLDGDEEHIAAPSHHWQRRARRALLHRGVAPTDAAIERTAETLLEAHVEGAELAIDRRALPSARAVDGAAGDGGALKITAAGERYLAERTRDAKAALSKQTAAQNEATFRLFAEFTGDAPLGAVTRRHVSDLRDTLAKLHRHYGRHRGAAELPLNKLLERHPAADGQGLSNKTLNRHLSALSSLWRWARRRGHLPDDRPNPFSEQMRDAGDNPYLPFAMEELSALFKGMPFDVRPKRHTLATARPWIMAAALYSGMRAGETCDLDAENVRERDGVPYFDVTRAKSKAGVRLIPVHSELVRLGFLEYVAAIGRGPLFPGIAPGSRGGGRAHTFVKRFPEFRRQRGVTRERLAFHSFRKCFVRALELGGVDRDRAALVVGHERGFTFRVYNPEGVDVAALREVVEGGAVSRDGVELNRALHGLMLSPRGSLVAASPQARSNCS